MPRRPRAREPVGTADRASRELVCVGQIGAPHGIRGEVRLKAFTEDPLAIRRYAPLQAEDGRCFAIDGLRAANEVLIVRFAGVADRNAAEALRNLRLYVPRSRLPQPGEGEFYHADLIGLSAVARDGVAIGKVTGVHNFGAGDLIEVIPDAGGPTILLPFTQAVVPEIDLAAGRLVVDPPDVSGREDGAG